MKETIATCNALTGTQKAKDPPNLKYIVTDYEHVFCLAIALAKGTAIDLKTDGITKRYSQPEAMAILSQLEAKGLIDFKAKAQFVTATLLVPFNCIDVDRSPQAIVTRILEDYSSDVRESRRTLLFFLNPSNRIDPDKYSFLELRAAISKEADWVWLKLQPLEYKDYLSTPYWQILSHRTKQDLGNSCVACGAKNNLHVHHRDYPKRGTEILNHLAVLTCLCGSCHELIHNAQTLSN